MILVFCTSSYDALHENILNGFQLTEQTRVHVWNGYVQHSKGNNSKSSQPELLFMHYAGRLMMLYIFVKFRENIINGTRVIERTRVHDRNGYVQRAKTPKVGKPEWQSMCSAHRLIVLNTGVKFHENISNGIRVMERREIMKCWRTLTISDGITISLHFLWRGIKNNFSTSTPHKCTENASHRTI